MPEEPGNDVDSLPLPTLLSHVLVAFTIEFSNEFERRSPHRTTTGGASRHRVGPWLTSMAMYSNLLRLVPDEGVTVRELRQLSRTAKPPLNGMERWGYIVVAPDPADKRPRRSPNEWVVRLTAKGAQAKKVWQSLFAEIERRWRGRFGHNAVTTLRAFLAAILKALDLDLPEYLPVLGYGLTAQVLASAGSTKRSADDPMDMSLPALLAKVLLAFTLEFEAEAEVSLAICANVLRLFAGSPIRVRDMPWLSGVSKEAIAVATGFLRARGYASIEPDPATARGKAIQLTAKGRRVSDASRKLLGVIEERWKAKLGASAIAELRRRLVAMAAAEEGGEPALLKGTEPHPENWRASIPRPQTLPHYPMVLHRGGYPDGS